MDSGLLLIDKPVGVTSRDVDNRIGRLFHTRRVGHLGTLDPFATGLLLVAVGEATKWISFLPDEEKTYVAKLKLGVMTSTGDCTGEVKEALPVPPLDIALVDQTLRSFLGEGTQLPPMTSAIKQGGVALYKLAHQGIEVERKPRPIVITDIKALSLERDELVFVATVSKGTYIRVLGEDIAKALGTVGHLSELRRVKIGDISVIDAISLDYVSTSSLVDPCPFVPYPHIRLEGETAKKAHNGVPLSFEGDDERLVLEDDDGVIAVYERKEGRLYRCLRGF